MANGEDSCGCCQGSGAITPQSTANRPGLPALAYRVGTHAAFLETMKSRLSVSTYPALSRLRTRARNDPSIALLEAWATVGDVLTFYQERIANEGYVRTATETRSVLELVRLIGYALRPGVAASVWLALELEKDYGLKILPYELKAQSLPGPGELPQTFENTEPIEARQSWNKLQPRLRQPQTIETITRGGDLTPAQPRIYVKGISTNMKQNDIVLLTVSGQPYELYGVVDVKADAPLDRTLLTLRRVFEGGKTGEAHVDMKAIGEAADLYMRADVMKKYLVSPKTEMAQRVLGRLGELSTRVSLAGMSARDTELAVRDTLTKIAAEQALATGEQYARLAKWLTAMSEDITKASERVMAAALEKAPANDLAPSASAGVGDLQIEDPLRKVMIGLTKKASVPPRNAISLDRNMARIFDTRADTGLQIAGSFQTGLQASLPLTLANVKVTPASSIRAYVFRATARPFGHNAPLKSRIVETSSSTGSTLLKTTTVNYDEWTHVDMEKVEATDGETIYLDAKYEKVPQDSWIIVDTSGVAQRAGTIIVPAHGPLLIGKVSNLKTGISRAAYGMSGPSTSTQVVDPSSNELKAWFEILKDSEKAVANDQDDSFQLIRQTTVYIESEELSLTDEPVTASICGGDEDLIELDGLYSGLQSGRWLIVAGERDDIRDGQDDVVRGVKAAELVMLAEATQKVNVLAGDQTHTFIKLAKKLEYCYRRDTVAVYGNVVKATHGETRKETLGGGDAGQTFQSFLLKQPPLTFTASAAPAGAESSLKVYVNDVQWHEKDSLADKGADERIFITRAGDGKTTVIFGNGDRGLRPPTGTENIRALYRNGIGKAGNVRSEQVNQLMSKPLGVKGVINPLRATGGADRESRDTARKNGPRTVTALDRLVSVSDYADFACTFAGVGKALAAKITDGKREWVHVTIAGAEDIPIDESSDLYRNLLQTLRDYGDPQQRVALQVRELMFLLINANVRIDPDYQWEVVAGGVRNKLLSVLGFERRELGQDVFLSEVIASIQSVRGVAYVDVDVLGGIPEKKNFMEDDRQVRRLLTPIEISAEAMAFLDQSSAAGQPQQRLPVNVADVENGIMRPAQLAYLSPDVSDTLVINQIK